jgi:cytochrome c-type biogenesis protein CcmH/NrfG
MNVEAKDAQDAHRRAMRRLPEQPNFHAGKAAVYAAGFGPVGIPAVAAAAAQLRRKSPGEAETRALPAFMLDADAA